MSEQKAAIERNGEATLLVVDDEPEIVALLDEYFTGLGYRVLTAEDGATALKRAEQSPDLIVLDEPTSALDPELTKDVLKVIRDLAAENMTMVIVTHEMNFARDVADHIVFMDGGVIVEAGAPAEVIDNPQSERTKEFFSKVL